MTGRHTSESARLVAEDRRRGLFWALPLLVGTGLIVLRVALELADPGGVTAVQLWLFGAFAVTAIANGLVYRVTDMRRSGLLPTQRRRLRSASLTAAPLTVTAVVLGLGCWLFS